MPKCPNVHISCYLFPFLANLQKFCIRFFMKKLHSTSDSHSNRKHAECLLDHNFTLHSLHFSLTHRRFKINALPGSLGLLLAFRSLPSKLDLQSACWRDVSSLNCRRTSPVMCERCEKEGPSKSPLSLTQNLCTNPTSLRAALFGVAGTSACTWATKSPCLRFLSLAQNASASDPHIWRRLILSENPARVSFAYGKMTCSSYEFIETRPHSHMVTFPPTDFIGGTTAISKGLKTWRQNLPQSRSSTASDRLEKSSAWPDLAPSKSNTIKDTWNAIYVQRWALKGRDHEDMMKTRAEVDKDQS